MTGQKQVIEQHNGTLTAQGSKKIHNGLFTYAFTIVSNGLLIHKMSNINNVKQYD